MKEALDPANLPKIYINSILREAEDEFSKRKDISGEKMLRGYKAGYLDGFKKAWALFHKALKDGTETKA